MLTEIKELYSNDAVESNFNQQNLMKLLIQSPQVKHEYRKMKKNHVINPIKSNEIYFLTSGIIVSQHQDFPISLQQTNEFIGLDTIILQGDYVDNYRPIIDCEVIVFQKSEVLLELLSHQEGWLFLALEMQKQNNVLTNRYLLMNENSFSRLSATFFELASKFGVKQDDAYILPKYFSKKFISEYAGLSPSSLKKMESLLKEEGIVDFVDKIYIVYLERYANSEKAIYNPKVLQKWLEKEQ
ncbi:MULTISPECIES: Crp/Fnr family transcriptional regulator [Listeria]|uniref:Crp/Fnr family transcriptional regulator n=1 Tax=Listeria TaxID=1637 RepID=UPI0015D04D36|nr:MULTISPECIES: Crp/Fnr family transcriptional regulator [Listeria]